MPVPDLKPFLFESEVEAAKGFILHLTIDFGVINRLEALLDKGMNELLGELATSTNVMVKFLWAMTRNAHPDLTLDQITGIVFSKPYGAAVCATLGDLVRRAFDVADDEEGEQSSRPPKRSGGASRGSSRNGARPASSRAASGSRRRAAS